MGIERFFSSIEQNNITNMQNSFTYKLQTQLNSEYLLIDFNSIIHITSSLVLSDMNYLLYQIITNSYKNNNKFYDIVKTYNIQLNGNLEYNHLLKYLTTDKLNEIIMKKVEDYIINMLMHFINPLKLKYLFIAVDGVPNKSKMIEQKKRRYMGTIINELKKKILQKHKNQLINESSSKNRYLYEIHKIEWSKIYISPGTTFMNDLDELLSSKYFNDKIKSICKNIKKYDYSGTNDFGEGEKKITNYAKKNINIHGESLNGINGYISIYSPDSDMTLLCLLLSNTIDNINIIRHNQQDNTYDIINIDLLKKNILNYVSTSLKINSKNVNTIINNVNVINDIVFILTIFGNDFLPKIESFNVKYDFNKIIDLYITILQGKYSDNNITYLINKNNLNQSVLVDLFKVLHKNEDKNLQKNYITSNYQNYNKLKKIINSNNENFTELLNNFLIKLRTLNDEIKSGSFGNTNINNWQANDPEFIRIMIKLTKLTEFKNTQDNQNINENLQTNTFLNKYIEYYNKYGKFPEIAVTFKKYSKSIKDYHHKFNLEKSLNKLDHELKITKYDEEIYKLDNMLDEYNKKLNATSLDLGYIAIDPQKYIWKTEKIEKGIERYYKDFFNIDINIKNYEASGMNKILNNYIEGLVWVFNYYYDIDTEISYKPSIWFYKYTHAPLISQLYYFLKTQNQNYIETLKNNLNKYAIESNNEYFKPLSHLMYVSPPNLYLDVIPEYKNYNKHHDNSINIEKIINNIWNNSISNEIDCRGVLFLNKCHINKIHINENILESWNNDKKFIKSIN